MLNELEVLMLTPMFNRKLPRNRYFHFHPMHSTFSLLAAIVLMGLLAWYLGRIH